jgi:hypothetical protein
MIAGDQRPWGSEQLPVAWLGQGRSGGKNGKGRMCTHRAKEVGQTLGQGRKWRHITILSDVISQKTVILFFHVFKNRRATMSPFLSKMPTLLDPVDRPGFYLQTPVVTQSVVCKPWSQKPYAEVKIKRDVQPQTWDLSPISKHTVPETSNRVAVQQLCWDTVLALCTITLPVAAFAS